MKLLALDLAAKTGWAVIDDGDLIDSGVLRLRGDLSERACAFGRWLCLTLRDRCITHVAYEDPHVRYASAAASGYTLRAVVWLVCDAARVPKAGASAAEVKQHATGRGNSGKAAMIAAARERWSIEPEDDNEADALCVAAWALDSVDWGE